MTLKVRRVPIMRILSPWRSWPSKMRTYMTTPRYSSYFASKTRPRSFFVVAGFGAGSFSQILSRRSLMPWPVFAET